ncbi:hypothetical protein [Microvirga alba]|uniref:Uncharacterized protein n=1 Tax=Microvirga alba TaxID=2791025 RepID=A0A931BXC1_9HYPH|nr:hypothetical protein [Microvirga alba]MBF9235555.1 hypothetical protein [Microvirga alba]
MNILDPRFKYIPACRTNIMDRFRSAGFVPPSELRRVMPSAEERLRQLRADLDRMAEFKKVGSATLVMMDADEFEACLAEADGFTRKVDA